MTRDAMRAWLNRRSPSEPAADLPAWRWWFDGEMYLGVRSARVGPDPVKSAQRCTCGQCENGRQANGKAPPFNKRNGERP